MSEWVTDGWSRRTTGTYCFTSGSGWNHLARKRNPKGLRKGRARERVRERAACHPGQGVSRNRKSCMEVKPAGDCFPFQLITTQLPVGEERRERQWGGAVNQPFLLYFPPLEFCQSIQ